MCNTVNYNYICYAETYKNKKTVCVSLHVKWRYDNGEVTTQIVDRHDITGGSSLPEFVRRFVRKTV